LREKEIARSKAGERDIAVVEQEGAPLAFQRKKKEDKEERENKRE